MGEPTGRRIFCEYWPDFGNNAPYSDINRPVALQIIQEKCALARKIASELALLPAIGLAVLVCQTAALATAAAAPAEEAAPGCGDGGFLRTQLYGALTATLDWGKHDLECSGMPRPEGRGARLRFAGAGPGAGQQVAFIIAIPDLTREALGDEYRSNVTLIEEGAGRFFSTPNLDNCLTNITSLTALDDSGDRFSIGGTLFCVSPLPQINGESSVSFSDVNFSGLIDWSSS